jgi:hypothetical protein
VCLKGVADTVVWGSDPCGYLAPRLGPLPRGPDLPEAVLSSRTGKRGLVCPTLLRQGTTRPANGWGSLDGLKEVAGIGSLCRRADTFSVGVCLRLQASTHWGGVYDGWTLHKHLEWAPLLG